MYKPISTTKAKIAPAPPTPPPQQPPQMGQQPPQPNTLTGARAGSTVPQSAPPQLDANRVNSQVQGQMQGGIPAAQSVNMAAQNPTNQYYKKGGPVAPIKFENSDMSGTDPTELATMMEASKGVPAFNGLDRGKPQKQAPKNQMEDLLQQYNSPEGQKYQQDRAKMTGPKASGPDDTQNYAKGGPVRETVKNMPLKDIIRLLASHPEVSGGNAPGSVGATGEANMAKGGMAVNMAREAKSHGLGLMNMNRDVPTYATGGAVGNGSNNDDDDDSSNPMGILGSLIGSGGSSGGGSDGVGDMLGGVLGKVAGSAVSKLVPMLFMAKGGSVSPLDQEEVDSQVSTDPNGNAIVENDQGNQVNGDLNQELGRPESAPTNGLAKGGSPVPPGSLSKEVADDVPAKLSQGEFVFSADATRFYGLKLLTALQDHARQELATMDQSGKIRSPGDGKNPGDGTFLQDKQPDQDFYDNDAGNGQDQDADEPTGILKECMGGANYSMGGEVAAAMKDENDESTMDPNRGDWNKKTDAHQEQVLNEGEKSGEVFVNNLKGKKSTNMAIGGGISEETSLKKGGLLSEATGGVIPDSSFGNDSDYGDSNTLNTTAMAKGGIVTDTSTSLTPKKFEGGIPSKVKKINSPKLMGDQPTAKIPRVSKMPQFKKGGLVNQARDINQTQSYVGS